jgi:drug/metabolite transporter (DMT)-like permease
MRVSFRFNPRLGAILLAVFVTVLWSTSWVLIKIGLRNDLPAITFAGLRYTLALICLIPFMLFNPSSRAELKHLSRKDWGKLALLGVVYYTITQSTMFLALDYLPANMVSLLLNLTTLFVGLSGIFFLKERPPFLQWVGITLAVAGVGVYFFPVAYPHSEMIGILIGLFCMGMNVASALLSREANRRGDLSPLLVTFVSLGIGSVLMLVTGLVVQGIGRLTVVDWIIIIWMAVINTALAFTLWNKTLRVLTAVESSIINSLMMPQIALLAFIFLGEDISFKQLIGLGLVFAGVIVVQLRNSAQKIRILVETEAPEELE